MLDDQIVVRALRETFLRAFFITLKGDCTIHLHYQLVSEFSLSECLARNWILSLFIWRVDALDGKSCTLDRGVCRRDKYRSLDIDPVPKVSLVALPLIALQTPPDFSA